MDSHELQKISRFNGQVKPILDTVFPRLYRVLIYIKNAVSSSLGYTAFFI